MLSLTAQAGSVYTLQASADLVNWVNIGRVLAGSDGMVRVEDAAAANYPNRYYRLLNLDEN